MEFTEYASIENSYRQKNINEIIERGYAAKCMWSVSEKVHGANSSIWMSKDDGPKFARRTDFLKEDEKFYCHKEILFDLQSTIWRLFGELVTDGAESLVVFGELFGGQYVHPDVPKSNHSRVQKGVQYHPSQQFMAFDMKIDGLYIGTDRLLGLCRKHGIPHLEPLFRGTFEECLAFDTNFQSTIPAIFGLPPLPEGIDNLCEGIVIKPDDPMFFPIGSRVILKKKNDKFSEKMHPPKEHREPKDIDIVVAAQVDQVDMYLNDARLDNVVSKIGQLTIKDFGKIAKALSEDVMDEYLKDNSEAYELLDKGQRASLSKYIGRKVAGIIKPRFMEIVDR